MEVHVVEGFCGIYMRLFVGFFFPTNILKLYKTLFYFFQKKKEERYFMSLCTSGRVLMDKNIKLTNEGKATASTGMLMFIKVNGS